VTPTPRLPLQLSANFFNPTTQTLDIGGLAEASGTITINIFNIAAEKVRHVGDLNATAGFPFRFTWDGRNDAGEYLGNGVYVIMMKSSKGVTLKKVIILK